MTKRQNNKKTKIGCVVFVGAKPDSPDVAPKLGVIVAKTKKPWLSIDPRFARPGEQPSDRNLSHPDELVRSHVPGAAQLGLGAHFICGPGKFHPGRFHFVLVNFSEIS